MRGAGYWDQTVSWLGMLSNYRDKFCKGGGANFTIGDFWIAPKDFKKERYGKFHDLDK